MGLLPEKWIKWIAVVLGAAGMLTPAMIELGWIPERHALKPVIFLLGFIVLEGAARESSQPSPASQLFTNSEDVIHAMTGLLSEVRQETLAVVHGNFIMSEAGLRFAMKNQSILRNQKQLHTYVIVVARIGDMSDESFLRRLEFERDPSVQERFHVRFIDSPVSFGCNVFDERHWEIDFPANLAEPKGAAILFRNHPEGARLIASFIHHQWLERPGVTMSMSEAYEKWKATASAPKSE